MDDMKIYSHKDPEARPILEGVKKYTQQAEALNMPYWVFVRDSIPVGLVAVGEEPVQLLASPGTPMAIIQSIDTDQPPESIASFVRKALRLATNKNNAEYALSVFPSQEREAISQFKETGFREFDDSYRMVCQLEKSFEASGKIECRRVHRDELRKFISFAQNCLQGSQDRMLREALKHFPELPKEFLDFYYTQEEFYFAEQKQQSIGVLSLNTDKGLISNIGVDPQKRRRGYGRQIILFALRRLKKEGCKQAYLRVHVQNQAAIHLYQSLGFKKVQRYLALMWKNRQTSQKKDPRNGYARNSWLLSFMR